MKIKKIIIASFLTVSALSLNSCWLALAGVAGGGTVAYIQGKYSMNMDGSIKEVYNSALEAVQNDDNLIIT